MPIVQIYLKSGRDNNKKRTLVKEVTKAICNSLDVPAENVRILLSEMAPENYAVAGEFDIDKEDSLDKKTDNEG